MSDQVYSRDSVRRGSSPAPAEDVAVGLLALRYLTDGAVSEDAARAQFERVGLRVDAIPILVEKAKLLADMNRGENPDLTELVRQATLARLASRREPLEASARPVRSWSVRSVLVSVVRSVRGSLRRFWEDYRP